jgi:ABC-type nitrate/sulfonate/bicarbonate transport system permease component
MAVTTQVKPPTAPDVPDPRKSRRRPSEKYVYGTTAVIAALVLWEVIALLRVRPAIVLPGPIDVVNAFQNLFSTNAIWTDLLTSGKELLLGLVFATIVGLPVGMMIGWYRRLSYVLNPFITFLYATPRIALTPLLIIWLGIGDTSKIMIVFLMAVFPILINAASGVQNLDPSILRVATCFGGTDLQIFRTIALPGTIPFIVSGLRLAVGQALIGVFVAELSGAQTGVGMMMNNAGQQFQTSVVFAGLFIFALTGVTLNALLKRAERLFDSWRNSAD